MNSLSACVVGFGHLGRHHARVYNELENISLKAIIDTDDAALKEAKSLGVPVYSDFKQAIKEVDIVSIATPTDTHIKVAREFIEAGIHVLIEKPLSSNISEARDIVKLARDRGVTLQVGHIERFNPAVTASAKYINNPLFIEADRVSPFSFRSIDISVVMDLMIHDIDLILHFANSPVKKVEAFGVPVLCKTEDIANAMIVFENGCVANVTASRVAIKTERKFRIFQKNAYISLDFASQKVNMFRKKKDFTEEDLCKFKEDGSNPLELMLMNYISQEHIKVEEYDQLTREIESFITAVREKKEPVVTGEHAVEAIRVADMIINSINHPPWAKQKYS